MRTQLTALAATAALATTLAACSPQHAATNVTNVTITPTTINIPAPTNVSGTLTNIGPVICVLPEGATHQELPSGIPNTHNHRVELADGTTAVIIARTEITNASTAQESVEDFIDKRNDASSSNNLQLADSVTWAPFPVAAATTGRVSPNADGTEAAQVLAVAGYDSRWETLVFVVIQAPEGDLASSPALLIPQTLDVGFELIQEGHDDAS